MNYSYYITDVFTDQPFHGVPVPVFTDASGLTEQKMQQIASELNASATVFLLPTEHAHIKEIKAFSKLEQMPTSTHSILAASFVLAQTGQVSLKDQHTLISLKATWGNSTQVIDTYVSKNASNQAGLVQQTYNTHSAIDYYTPTTEELAAMLSLSPADIGFDHYRPLIVSCGVPYLVVPIMSYSAIREAKFNEAAWSNSSAPSSLAQEILLFANNTDNNPADFHARLLGPAIAHHEDPPIGGAIAAFANHICDHAHIQAGTHVFAIQRGANDARKSMFYVEMDNKQSKDLTIRVGGNAVLMSEASITVD
ncbi:MAG: PhzF family phenazine biosynthesis protein [Colwellia sp.]|nr:PhzF family phenazine biosynthesis protein [Colwellia sp.]MCW8866468.1 PhzF family phenazine biosynthesis protein [Colwellia sp.]MCW9080612.1 PhzF family phenazine biosynthesis protein [Colwellia sp.]